MIKKLGVFLLILFPFVIAAEETDPFEYSPFEKDSFSRIGTVNAVSADEALVTVSVILYYSGGKEAYTELVSKSFLLRERIEIIIAGTNDASLNKITLQKLILKDLKKYLNTAEITGIVFSSFEITGSTSISEIDDF